MPRVWPANQCLGSDYSLGGGVGGDRASGEWGVASGKERVFPASTNFVGANTKPRDTPTKSVGVNAKRERPATMCQACKRGKGTGLLRRRSPAASVGAGRTKFRPASTRANGRFIYGLACLGWSWREYQGRASGRRRKWSIHREE